AMAQNGNFLLSCLAVLLAAVSGGVAVVAIGRNLRILTKREFERWSQPAFAAGQGTARVGTLVVLPLVVAVVSLLLTASSHGEKLGSAPGRVISFFLLWLLIAQLQRTGGFILCYTAGHDCRRKGVRGWLEPRLHLLWMSLATVIFMHVLLYQVSRLLKWWSLSSAEGSQNAIAWMPPLYLGVLMLGITLQIGLM